MSDGGRKMIVLDRNSTRISSTVTSPKEVDHAPAKACQRPLTRRISTRSSIPLIAHHLWDQVGAIDACFVKSLEQDAHRGILFRCTNEVEKMNTPRWRPAAGPGYWQYETTGVLRPVVENYMLGEDLNTEQVAVMRAYLRQWIGSPVWDQNPHATDECRAELAELRQWIDRLETHADIEQWLAAAVEAGIDPL